MSLPYYKHGSYNVICDRCGFKFKAEQLRREWTGLYTCSGGGTNDCWEVRHPLDYIRTKPETPAPIAVSPEPTDSFVSVTYTGAGVQENTIPTGTFNNAR